VPASAWSPRELLRPPPHRGPLIAAGAVLLTVGLALLELRLHLGAGVHVLILGAAAALVLGLGAQAPNEGGRPPAYQSVLLVAGLLLLAVALLRLADALGAGLTGGPSSGTVVWTGFVEAVVAGWVAAFRRSAVAALISALAAGVALLAALDLLFAPSSFAPARWVLLVLAVVLVVGSLALRAGSPRHAELLVDGAALAILTIALQALVAVVLGVIVPFASVPQNPLPGFWELVVLAAGCGLVAYGAVDRSPGPAWLGVANLLAFVAIAGTGGETLRWWPLTLIVLGLVTLAAALRPRSPLPPEPPAAGYRAGEQPLAARSAEDEIVVRVRDDRPGSG
jgi:hypothetical protein